MFAFTIATHKARFAIAAVLVLVSASFAAAQQTVPGSRGKLTRRPSQSLAGQTYSRVTPVLKPLTSIPRSAPRLGFYGHFTPNLGMVVDAVIVGETAHQLGLETGDVIVQINDQPLDSVEDYFSALASAAGQGSMIIQDIRTGQQVEVPLTPGQPLNAGLDPQDPGEPAPPPGADNDPDGSGDQDGSSADGQNDEAHTTAEVTSAVQTRRPGARISSKPIRRQPQSAGSTGRAPSRKPAVTRRAGAF